MSDNAEKKKLKRFHATVVIEAETLEEAQQALNERICYEEELDFDYEIWVRDDAVEEI